MEIVALAATVVISGVVALAAPAGAAVILQAALVQVAVWAVFYVLQQLTGLNTEWAEAFTFAICTGYNAQLLIHEAGHAMAAKACYSKVSPEIVITPFGASHTHFVKSALSGFGKCIGPVAVTALIVAAGPALTLLISTIALIVGMIFREELPKLSKYLIAWGIVDFISQSYYAYSAIGMPTNLGHDFVHLSVFGLDPGIAAIAILLVPVVITSVGILLQKEEAPLAL